MMPLPCSTAKGGIETSLLTADVSFKPIGRCTVLGESLFLNNYTAFPREQTVHKQIRDSDLVKMDVEGFLKEAEKA